jgi:hypothetical protein
MSGIFLWLAAVNQRSSLALMIKKLNVPASNVCWRTLPNAKLNAAHVAILNALPGCYAQRAVVRYTTPTNPRCTASEAVPFFASDQPIFASMRAASMFD